MSHQVWFINKKSYFKIYSLSLHDALPIFSSPEIIATVAQAVREHGLERLVVDPVMVAKGGAKLLRDRKRTRLNSSHMSISYAVFCLKKKINNEARKHTIRIRVSAIKSRD